MVSLQKVMAKQFISRLSVDLSGIQTAERTLTSLSKIVQAVNHQVKEVDKSVFDTVNKFNNRFAGFLASLKKLSNFIGNVNEMNHAQSQLAAMSNSLGSNLRELDAWSKASTLFGGSANKLQNSFEQLGIGIGRIQNNTGSSLLPWFDQLNIAIKKSNGQWRSYTDILLDVSSRIHDMPSTQKNEIGQNLGLDKNTIALLSQGRESVVRYLREIDHFSQLNQNSGTEAAAFQLSVQNLMTVLNQLAMSIGNALKPALDFVNEGLNRLSRWANQNATFIKNFLYGLIIGFGALAVATFELWAPFVALAAAITAVAGIFALIKTAFDNWMNGDPASLITGLIGPFSQWKDTIENVKNAVSALWEFIKNLIEVVSSLAQVVMGLLFRNITKPIISKIFENLINQAMIFINLIGNLAAALNHLMQGNWSAFWTDLKNAFLGRPVEIKVKSVNELPEKPLFEEEVGQYQLKSLNKIMGNSNPKDLVETQKKFSIQSGQNPIIPARYADLLPINKALTPENNYAMAAHDIRIGAASRANLTQSIHQNSQTKQSAVNINGDIHINTQATDAQGIANSLSDALQYRSLATSYE